MTIRPLGEHLFGISTHSQWSLPYCTCGLIFRVTSSLVAREMRREWVAHVKKVINGTETRDPLSNI